MINEVPTTLGMRVINRYNRLRVSVDLEAHQMGCGLSQLQNDILGLAFVVNAHTRGGEPKVKVGLPMEGYLVSTSDYAGPVDYATPLGVHAIYGIPLSN